jgi:sulfate transport system permease protein
LDQGAGGALQRRRHLRPNFRSGKTLSRSGFRPRSIIPGFGLTFGFTVFYLCVIVLIPLSAIFIKTAGLGWDGYVAVALSRRALLAYRLSFGAAAIAAAINSIFGLIVAWVLVRYEFPGKRVVSALVDLPFALPTAVAGIALTALYAPNGWLGALLGQTFARVVLPAILPSLATGFALAFARGVGEYGSVIFIAGNLPFKSEIAPLLIVQQLEQYNYAGATAIAATMLMASFAVLFAINLLQAWDRSRMAPE